MYSNRRCTIDWSRRITMAFLEAHGLVVGIIAMWLVSNAIGAMPTPRDNSSVGYEWAFKFAQSVGGGISRVLAVYSPSTLTALTGQQVKVTTPPNPPVAAGEPARQGD
jgi:hypothetical protein